MRGRHAGALLRPGSHAIAACSLIAMIGQIFPSAPVLLGDECAQRCEVKLVRITVGDLLKVDVYNRDGKLTNANPLVKPDDKGIQDLLKAEVAKVQEPVPVKGKECEKGCRCVVDRSDPNLKWIENKGNFTISVTFSHFAGKDVFTWKVKREVAIASGVCDIEPPG